jgi:hypothetical protein
MRLRLSGASQRFAARRLLWATLVWLPAFLLWTGTAGAADPTATIAVVPPVTLNSDGSVSVTVIATCVPLDMYKGLPPLAEVVVVQESGQKVVRGSFGAVVVCDNAPHQYEIRVASDQASARFHGGFASVVAIISGCGFLDQALVCERQDPPPQPETVIVRGPGAAGT